MSEILALCPRSCVLSSPAAMFWKLGEVFEGVYGATLAAFKRVGACVINGIPAYNRLLSMEGAMVGCG